MRGPLSSNDRRRTDEAIELADKARCTRFSASMPTVHDIHCPECHETEPVVKEGIDAYRCTDCERSFTVGDVLD